MSQTIIAVKDRSDVISIITISDKSLSEGGIKLLSVDGVAPTKQNLQSGPIRSAVRSTLSTTRSW